MKKWLFRAFFLMLAAGIVVFYVYDIRVNHTHPSENLFRTIAIVCICISGFLRVGVSASRRSLKFYDAQYADILGNAFVNQPFWRNKMLCAVRLYNENNYDKALKYLADMKQRCQTQDDIYAVMLFKSLCPCQKTVSNCYDY